MTLDYTWERREMLIRREEREEALQEGRKEGLQTGLQKGLQKGLITQICKKLRKGQSVPQIADALETDVDRVQRIVDVAKIYAPDYDEEKVMEAWSTAR